MVADAALASLAGLCKKGACRHHCSLLCTISNWVWYSDGVWALLKEQPQQSGPAGRKSLWV